MVSPLKVKSTDISFVKASHFTSLVKCEKVFLGHEYESMKTADDQERFIYGCTDDTLVSEFSSIYI